MTTWVNSQFPRPDFHRQVQRHYGLHNKLRPKLPRLTSTLQRTIMEDLPLFSVWKGRSYGSKIVIRAIFTAFSTPDHLALLPTVGWQGAPFCAESSFLSCRSLSSVGTRLRSYETETGPGRVGPPDRSPRSPGCGRRNPGLRASVRRHRRAQGGWPTLRPIRLPIRPMRDLS